MIGCCSVAKSCPILCDLIDCSTPGFPVLHSLPEFAQVHVHWSQWCYLTISFSAVSFPFCLQFFPASGSFPMSWLFASGGQSIGAVNIINKCSLLSSVWLFVTPWTVACQSPLSMKFSRQEYWSGWPFSSPGNFPNPGIKPGSPALQIDSLPCEPPWKP